MSAELTFDNVVVNDASDCYVIAEIGNNHQGDLDKCRQLFVAAREAGANAVKLQKRDNRTLFTKAMYDQAYNSENAFAPTYGAHRDFLEFGRDEYVELRKLAKELNITFFATAFDISSADFLEELEMPFYKIASADLTNIPLLKHVAAFGKPVIVSTGGGSMTDIRRMYDAVMPINRQLSILQCTASYPCEVEKLNLRVIETLRREFPGVVVGLSAHDNGIAMPVVAYMLGARVVEKHFTLNRSWRGTDHAFSLAPDGMRKMVRDLQRTRAALGDGVKRVLPEEEAPIKKMSKKLVAARPLAAGHVLQVDDIALKSPGDGLPPYDLDRLIGRTLATALEEDATFSWDCVAGSAPK
ncbi:N-acetylneuraminate synthase family protein [Ferrovibrio sp.]|uniref:N-acetylneuraminate synthase family protein n=1 Tax=Ferrovibrio sp. TaxID=1917215 RepID=UPI000CB9282F|nr:N-acetylneuraminate synthase family protein [Ferrovibrio sp.]PJI41906.1 MAG: N-acetylneuraminate synthase [Ferrovibrio sp.]